MNRKDFFKKLGLGAIVAFTAPKLLTKEETVGSYDHLRPIEDATYDAWCRRTYLTDHNIGEQHHFYTNTREYNRRDVVYWDGYPRKTVNEVFNNPFFGDEKWMVTAVYGECVYGQILKAKPL